jgi:hypothetical protein
MPNVIDLQARFRFIEAVDDSVSPNSVRPVTRKLPAKLRTSISVFSKRVN